jgi:hypothetical protein
LQRTQLLDNQESQDHSGSSGDEEVLQALPEAYAAQRGQIGTAPDASRELLAFAES